MINAYLLFSAITLFLYTLAAVPVWVGIFKLRQINRLRLLPGKTKAIEFPAGEGYRDHQRLPRVSVIIPVRNEQRNILRVLSEMAGQQYPHELFEIIVSDDDSDDETLTLARTFRMPEPGPVLHLISSGSHLSVPAGKKSALDRAIRQASGEIILSTDADSFHGEGWVNSMVGKFDQDLIRMVLGPVMYIRGANLLQELQQAEFMGIMGVTAGSAAAGYPLTCNGANLAYRKEAWFKVNGFSDHLQYASGDDQFLMASVVSEFGRNAVVFAEDQHAIVRTYSESTLSAFFHQRIRWISKSAAYRDPFLVMTGMITWLTIMELFAGLILGIISPQWILFSAAGMVIKMLIDLPAVYYGLNFSDVRLRMHHYIIAQIFQIIYVPVITAGVLVIRPKWKGRSIRLAGRSSSENTMHSQDLMER